MNLSTEKEMTPETTEKNTTAGKGTQNEGIKTLETNDPNMERHGKLKMPITNSIVIHRFIAIKCIVIMSFVPS